MSFLSKFKSFKVSVMIEKVIIIMKCEISIQVLSKFNLIIYNNSLKVKLTRLHTVIMKCNQPTPINSLNLCTERKGKLFQMY